MIPKIIVVCKKEEYSFVSPYLCGVISSIVDHEVCRAVLCAGANVILFDGVDCSQGQLQWIKTQLPSCILAKMDNGEVYDDKQYDYIFDKSSKKKYNRDFVFRIGELTVGSFDQIVNIMRQ